MSNAHQNVLQTMTISPRIVNVIGGDVTNAYRPGELNESDDSPGILWE